MRGSLVMSEPRIGGQHGLIRPHRVRLTVGDLAPVTTRRPRTMAPNWSAATVAPQSFTSPTAFGLISREFASSQRE